MEIKERKIIKPKEYHAPIAIPPGETIKEFINELGMTQKELATRMGMSEKHLSHLIKGSVELTRETAEKLELILSINSSFWINLENSYREILSKSKKIIIFEEEIVIAQTIPYVELSRNDWVASTRKLDEKVISLRQFFGISNLSNLEDVNVAYRKANLLNENKYALLCWIRIAELQAQKIQTKKFDRKKLIEIIPELRRLTLEDDFFPKLLALCAEAGIALVVSDHLKGTGVQGVTFFNSKKDRGIIQLSVRGKYADKFWFTLFHEICHILDDKKNEFNYITQNKKIEALIDEMAANELIPKDKYNNFVSEKTCTEWRNIEDFARSVEIHPGIVVGRMKLEERLPYTVYTNASPKLEIVKPS